MRLNKNKEYLDYNKVSERVKGKIFDNNFNKDNPYFDIIRDIFVNAKNFPTPNQVYKHLLVVNSFDYEKTNKDFEEHIANVDIYDYLIK